MAALLTSASQRPKAASTQPAASSTLSWSATSSRQAVAPTSRAAAWPLARSREPRTTSKPRCASRRQTSRPIPRFAPVTTATGMACDATGAMTASISTIPQLGFGVFQVPAEDTAAVVGVALETGYRHVDTAAAYGNEAGVGEAVRTSGLDREEVFITTKCWNDSQGRERSRRSLEKSLGRLGLDFVDLYLIHWPAPSKDLYVETWEALVQAREDGLARTIGVSNFQAPHLERIVEATGVTPAVNQIELHPRLQQAALREVHARQGIVTEAWSPLAKGEVLDDPAIARIASAHERTPG